MPLRKATVTLTLMQGAEPWIRVTHSKGWFKVPADVTLLEALTGALEGWSGAPRKCRRGEATVRVPLTTWSALSTAAGARLSGGSYPVTRRRT